MEGGEFAYCCTSIYAGDYLATSGNVTESRHTHIKRWLVSGFNGFGQLDMSKRKLPQFEEFKTPLVLNKAPLLFACSWSYLAVASERSVCLQGYISNKPSNFKSYETDTNVKALAANNRFCLVLQQNGKLYKIMLCDPTEMKEVKFETNNVPLLPQKRSSFNERKFTKESKIRIDFVACGDNIMVAIGMSNEVYSGCTQIHQFAKHVLTQQLVCGFEHALLLTTNGEIYAWGNGLRGQLGQEDLRIGERPVLVEALAGLTMSYIAASGWHCAAISTTGDFYAWGCNSNGQLGVRCCKYTTPPIKEPTVYPLPQIIETPNCCCKCNCVPIKVVCGARHTALVMECGSIFTCGYNAYGQLGVMATSKSCDALQYALHIEDVNSIEIIAGAWCTIIGAK